MARFNPLTKLKSQLEKCKKYINGSRQAALITSKDSSGFSEPGKAKARADFAVNPNTSWSLVQNASPRASFDSDSIIIEQESPDSSRDQQHDTTYDTPNIYRQSGDDNGDDRHDGGGDDDAAVGSSSSINNVDIYKRLKRQDSLSLYQCRRIVRDSSSSCSPPPVPESLQRHTAPTSPAFSSPKPTPAQQPQLAAGSTEGFNIKWPLLDLPDYSESDYDEVAEEDATTDDEDDSDDKDEDADEGAEYIPVRWNWCNAAIQNAPAPKLPKVVNYTSDYQDIVERAQTAVFGEVDPHRHRPLGRRGI